MPADALKEAVDRLTKLTFDTETHYGSERLGWMVGDVPTEDLRTILPALSAAQAEREDAFVHIASWKARAEAAEARERVTREALTSIRTQADNAAYNAHRSGITIDNAQLVRIFEGMEEQAARALTSETPHAE